MNSELPADIRSVADFFGLPDVALVEKDWYVVQALAALATVDITPYRLIFGGGTALSRAYRLIRRMSEDIDLKIVGETAPPRPALRRIRDAITAALHAAGFRFDPADRARRDSRNASRYTIYRLPYASIAAGKGALRPEIQIETAVWPLYCPAVTLPVASFVAEALHQPPEVPAMACVSIAQTAAEKFVALTRRTAAEMAAAAGSPRDRTLVRHLYDVHMIRPHYDPAEVAALVRIIMPHDAEAFGNQFPAYRANPLARTLHAVEALAMDPVYAQRYAAFHQTMVYGEAVAYAACVTTLQEVTRQLMGA